MFDPLKNNPAEKQILIDNQYQVWTKKVGQGPLKMLCLHGGPGATHEYLSCFEQFLNKEEVTFYLYDQLGSGNSHKPDDKSLWQIPRFIEEVEQVRQTLGLEDFVLYGQSWGGILAIEYALKYPEHLQGLIISNMSASFSSYIEYINELRQKLPLDIQEILNRYESQGDYSAPEYEKIMVEQIYSQYICRLNPMPQAVLETMKNLNQDVYHTMQGPNEFVATGNLKTWDRWDDLSKITIPTLLSVGRHDTMRVEDIQKMGELMPDATVSICDNGSHLSMHDDSENYFRDLNLFLNILQNQYKKKVGVR